MSQTAQNYKPEPAIEVPKPILYTGRFLQFFSTSLAAKFAQRLFITPFKHKMPKREFHMDKETEQTQLTVTEILKTIVVFFFLNLFPNIILICNLNLKLPMI